MNFTGKDFDAFSVDLKRALRDVCEKYQVRIKNSRIRYGEVDFDIKLTFEKDEMGLPVERIKFENECRYYGFNPEDYLRVVEDKGIEYEFAGFSEGARKYKCIIRDILTGQSTRITEGFMHHLLEQCYATEDTNNYEEVITPEVIEEKQQESEILHINEVDSDNINVLSEKELSMLRLKMSKSKRTEKDWAQIKELLYGKIMFTYIPEEYCPIAECVDEMAVENGIIVVYTDRQLLEQHLNHMDMLGLLGKTTMVSGQEFEEFIRRADRNHLDIIFDSDEIPIRNKCYLFYLHETQTLKAQYFAKA